MLDSWKVSLYLKIYWKLTIFWLPVLGVFWTMARWLFLYVIFLEFGPSFPLLLTLGFISMHMIFLSLPFISHQGCWPLHLAFYTISRYWARVLSSLNGKWHCPLNHLCVWNWRQSLFVCQVKREIYITTSKKRRARKVTRRFGGKKGGREMIKLYGNISKIFKKQKHFNVWSCTQMLSIHVQKCTVTCVH